MAAACLKKDVGNKKLEKGSVDKNKEQEEHLQQTRLIANRSVT